MPYTDKEKERERARQYWITNKEKIKERRKRPDTAAKTLEYKRNYNRAHARKCRDAKASRPRPDACESCGVKPTGVVVFDHCHATGEFRGWLCSGCNSALGMLKDDPDKIKALLTYLLNTRILIARVDSLTAKSAPPNR
jgi:hypothetical protein